MTDVGCWMLDDVQHLLQNFGRWRDQTCSEITSVALVGSGMGGWRELHEFRIGRGYCLTRIEIDLSHSTAPIPGIDIDIAIEDSRGDGLDFFPESTTGVI